jgi:hypothetical protein
MTNGTTRNNRSYGLTPLPFNEPVLSIRYLYRGAANQLCPEGLSLGMARDTEAPKDEDSGQQAMKATNPAHSLDGGITSQFHLARAWPAASDVRR